MQHVTYHDRWQQSSSSSRFDRVTFHRLETPVKFLGAFRVRSQPVATAVSPMALSGLSIGHDNARAMPARCLMVLF